MPTARTIQARLHPDALKRVTRMYGASLEDVIGELFQNARRAGASHLTATVNANPNAVAENMHYRLTIADNGSGIADPQLLISFGENGWDDSLVQAEDAAGMGFASISRYRSQITSRTADGGAWTVKLEPAHFLGEAAAHVEDSETGTGDPGTSVTVSTDEPPSHIRNLIQDAARHFPVDVTYVCTLPGNAENSACEQQPFLKEALYTTSWKGLDIGVFPVNSTQHSLLSNINFFGHTVKASLPTLRLLSGLHLQARIDVRQCPNLELVLPARKEVVKNAFLGRLKDHLKTILYEAARASGLHVAYKDFEEAASHGIDLAPPPPKLPHWHPTRASENYGHLRTPIYDDVPEDAFIVSANRFLECPEAWTLENALRKAGLMDKAFAPRPELEGYDWYSKLPELSLIECLVGGQNVSDLSQEDLLNPQSPHELRSNDLTLRLTFSDAGKKQVRVLPVDFILTGYPSDWCDGAACFIPKDTGLDVDALTRLYLHAYFEYADDGEFDSFETQEHNFRLSAREEASRLLLSEDAALRQSVRDALSDRVPWVFRKGQTTVITITGTDLALTCTKTEEAPTT